ncbi:MAG: ROK family protein [Cyclobacteriaceae bacterium]|nr:ROK family protein [Cyclobacteriaceae bacterium]
MSNLWGIDLGGTKIEGAVLKSAVDPQVLFRDRMPTEGQKGYDHILGQVKKVVDMMEASMGYKPSKIGMGTPGTLDPQTGLMKNSNSTALNGKPLKQDIEKMLGIEVSMANDANCFALAEANMGAAHEKYPDARVVFGVIMGTGVGGGVVVDGKVINGLQGIGGEWGHNFLDATGGSCYCGKSGCVEKVLAGPALEKYYAGISGAPKSMKDIYEGYKAGTDPFAIKTIERLHHFFGAALSVVVNILDPDVVVIGGGVGNIDTIYTEGLKSLKQHIFNNRLDTPILKPKLGDSAGVFGAAFLVS